MIHVYYGDGKGKTTAAAGLAVRAAGTGMKVYVVRFLKTENSGEVKSLRQLENIIVEPITKSFGFTFDMTPEQKEEAKIYYTEMLRKAISKENVEKYDMFVMDEVNIVFGYGFIDKQELLDFLKEYGQKKEIVITGAVRQEEIVELADYVTEIKKEKHPYDKGVNARKGIEF
ncbi:cob(I)yrinic acid a,c-diamide adenosyltransferase [[Clostridium] polysaccharolyticum]|uniref:Cob(I)alamin adenosyltransferase n=1 Tax=[Clostridium] polysaccharolyticum TaxID=29364 RepID=A0A1I0D7V2_9FIRM|nr:cob(I)yrinic acid a,c-diamide adenosyltransferase [[Clostridium] polysaccharolyticum]SET28314.1 cob(I)alamin adenosyltransferase [[Clostridium] polysaccharolyticum]